MTLRERDPNGGRLLTNKIYYLIYNECCVFGNLRINKSLNYKKKLFELNWILWSSFNKICFHFSCCLHQRLISSEFLPIFCPAKEILDFQKMSGKFHLLYWHSGPSLSRMCKILKFVSEVVENKRHSQVIHF